MLITSWRSDGSCFCMRAGSIRPTLGLARTPQGPNLAWSSALASRLGPSGSTDFSGTKDLCIHKLLDCEAFKAGVVQAYCSKRLARGKFEVRLNVSLTPGHVLFIK